jgi:hypothetical protein
MERFQEIIVGGKRYPAAITNYSLSMGEKLGLLNGSNLSDLIDCKNHLTVIYLAVIGVNKDFHLPFVDFIFQLQYKEDEIEEIYKNILLSCTNIKPNKFAEGLKNSTSKKIDKNQKLIKPPKLNIECVEDRYVLYCLIYGIDSELFWYHPIPDVERIYESINAYKSWQNNPK